jgi:hypothetical protein
MIKRPLRLTVSDQHLNIEIHPPPILPTTPASIWYLRPAFDEDQVFYGSFTLGLDPTDIGRWRHSLTSYFVQIVTHMVMSIISALAAATQFSLGVFSATFDDFAFSPPSTGCYYNVGQYQEGDDIGVSI